MYYNMNSCVICLPILNCEKYLNSVLNNILKIKTIFTEISIIFGYDHSNDRSMEILKHFKETNDIDVSILINNNKRYKYRTHNLEYIRNLMIECVYKKYSHYTFFIMMDSDDVCSSSINIDVLKKHLTNTIWDCLTFNRVGYYDIWALQYDIFIHHFRCFSNYSWPIIYFVRDDIIKKLNSNTYVSVYSAFNGFGIYKLDKFKNIKYDGRSQFYFNNDKVQHMVDFFNDNIKKYRKKDIIHITNSKENCEHIGFHINAIQKNNARIYITSDILFDDN